ncbi:MAG: hypothetical protein NC390_05485 [Fusobacterium sp.]|nr:hypothetical protein [Fusobacterium sp.]
MATAAALVAGGPAASTLMTSCQPDLEMSQTQHQEMWVNLKDYHKCGCGDIPIIIPRDTVYLPGDTIVTPPDTIIKNDTVYLPGDTIYLPGDTIITPPDTIVKTDTVYLPGDTIITPPDTIVKTDTIYLKPDTVYIPKKPHFEINDSINKDIEDFDIPTEGDGDFVWAFQGRNEYLGANHLLVFNGFFSSERQSSFVDHAFEEDDIPAGSDKPSKYYYTRYDISSDYENGRRLVRVYHPRENRHQLPDDKKRGEAGWKQVGEFYVKNASVAGTAQLIANDMDGAMKARITKNEKRGPGNLYKVWPLNDNQMPKTTIQNVKAYRKDLDNLED